MLFDERVLEDQRLVLALARDHLEIEDARDQLVSARLERIDAREPRTQPVAHVRRLAHVD